MSSLHVIKASRSCSSTICFIIEHWIRYEYDYSWRPLSIMWLNKFERLYKPQLLDTLFVIPDPWKVLETKERNLKMKPVVQEY